MPPEENRKARRRHCQQPVRIENCDTGTVIAGSVYDYSTTGLYFEANLAMAPGTPVRLIFEKQSPVPGIKETRGIIRWCQEIEGAVVLFSYGCGVECDSPMTGARPRANLRVIEGGISAAAKKRRARTKKNT